MTSTRESDLSDFQRHRPQLLGLAYRMLGDMGRAEDLLQDAWLRWSERGEDAREVQAYLVTLVTRLCLNELGSARARREESRTDRLPEPVAISSALGRVEDADRISMAFLVMLQRLTPAERAVLLLHDVFDFDHAEVAERVGKSTATCRKLLERARTNLAAEKRLLQASREEHRRLLEAFVRASTAGDTGALVALLAKDATLVTDGGPAGRVVGGIKNLGAPLTGSARIAAFVTTAATRNASALSFEILELNAQPALVLRQNGEVFGVLTLGVADGLIARVFFHADPRRLGRVTPNDGPAATSPT